MSSASASLLARLASRANSLASASCNHNVRAGGRCWGVGREGYHARNCVDMCPTDVRCHDIHTPMMRHWPYMYKRYTLSSMSSRSIMNRRPSVALRSTASCSCVERNAATDASKPDCRDDKVPTTMKAAAAAERVPQRQHSWWKTSLATAKRQLPGRCLRWPPKHAPHQFWPAPFTPLSRCCSACRRYTSTRLKCCPQPES